MTNEEHIEQLKKLRSFYNGSYGRSINKAIQALEQESKTEQFAKWVASEIFDDNWEYNKDAFAELACRKLEKLGIVIAKGDEWVLVEQEESEEE